MNFALLLHETYHSHLIILKQGEGEAPLLSFRGQKPLGVDPLKLKCLLPGKTQIVIRGTLPPFGHTVDLSEPILDRPLGEWLDVEVKA